MDFKGKWCIGYNLKKRWGDISHDNLVQYLLDGDLIAYPNIVSEPYSKEAIEEYVRNCHENPWMYEHGVWGFSFRVDNILKFEKLHNITVSHDKDKNETKIAKQDIPSVDIQNETTEKDPDVFIRDHSLLGEYFRVIYRYATGRVAA